MSRSSFFMNEMVATPHGPWYAAADGVAEARVENNPATTMTASRRNDDGAVTRGTVKPVCERLTVAWVRPPHRF
jgi:hypothetical protein